MNRLSIVSTLVGCVLVGSPAQAAEPDSIQVRQLGEVVVKAVQAPRNAPFAVSRIQQQELEEFSRTAQELPILFSRTPGVIAWSENGLGTGTTYMRIRGAGDSRINVTLDGVSLNSPEDQCVFWANTNSYATLLSNVQIQRGVGTSTNGDGAFGGSIALTTRASSYRLLHWHDGHTLPAWHPHSRWSLPPYGDGWLHSWHGWQQRKLLWSHHLDQP